MGRRCQWPAEARESKKEIVPKAARETTLVTHLGLLTPETVKILTINLRCCCFPFLAMPRGIWNLSSLTRDPPLRWERGILTPGPPGKSL